MYYVKRFLAVGLLAVLVLAGAIVPSASAHYLESDNGISAIFHIKPDDRPVTGKMAPIRFLFSDENGGFSLNKYKIDFTLSKDDEVVYTQLLEPAFFGAAAEGQVNYTFTEPGAYNFQVKGTPKGPDKPAFTLNYVANVADSSVKTTAQGDGSTTALLSGFSLVMVGMVAGKAIQSGGKYQRKKS